ncbi:MAG TPA: hypothetical protein VFG69_01125 [Nannocystaceae bacterium]|nr:hypothetical protein [Nannocystaceae bacterium]
MSCPFCGAALRDAPAPHAIAAVVLGFALMGCGDRDECADGATTAASSGSAMDDAACGQNSTLETEAGGGEDYAGPEPTEDSYEPPDDTTEEGGATESTGADTSGGETTAADTGGSESTGGDTTDAGGSSGESDSTGVDTDAGTSATEG